MLTGRLGEKAAQVDEAEMSCAPTEVGRSLPPSASEPDADLVSTENVLGSELAALPMRSGGRMLGRYHLLRRLGQGGMGVVYEAVHQDLRKRAAIKVLHPQFAADSGVRARFLREGQAASRVRHPNVVDVYDVAVEDAEPYLVMELLDGENLAALFQRSMPLAVEQMVDISVPIAAALAAAHDLGIIHRDLKPENVLLSRTRAGLVPKVLDFGISKVLDAEAAQRLTGSVALLGTPCYMSPEQAKNARRIDGRADIYSIGVLLYEGLTGSRPFHGDALYVLLNAIVAGQFARPSKLQPDLPAELEAIVLRAMATRPEDRFPDARALGLALLPFASERTRLNYSDELTQSTPSPLLPPESEPLTHECLGADALAPQVGTLHRNITTVPSEGRRYRGLTNAIVGAVLGGLGLGIGLLMALSGVGGVGTIGSTTPSPAIMELQTRQVVSVPSRARVVVGGRVRCVTPCFLEFGPDETSLVARVEADGFLPETRTLRSDDADPIRIILSPVEVAPTPSTASGLASNGSAAGIGPTIQGATPVGSVRREMKSWWGRPPVLAPR